MITSNELSAADIAAVTGNNNGFGGFGNDGAFWLLVLFLFGFGNNGWGGGGNMNDLYPWINQSNQVNDGFRDQMMNSGINAIQSGMTAGFAQAEASNNARQIADMNQNFSNQMAIMQGFNNVGMGIAGLGADVAREACADRQAVSEALMGVTAQNNQNTNAIINAMNAGFQNIQNQNYQDKIDAKDTEIANLRTQLNMQNLATSQAQQTAQLIADNAAQTQYVVNRVAPYPVPAFIDGTLVVYELEKMSPSFDGIRINQLVNSIIALLVNAHQRETFMAKLQLFGFDFSNENDKIRVELKNMYKYKVDTKDFPRLHN